MLWFSFTLSLSLSEKAQIDIDTLQIVLGNGCGHTLLGAESGTLASQNYPGTYPSNTFCKWRLRLPEGRTLRLLFGDFDIESSPGCSNGSLVITDKNGYTSLGKSVTEWKVQCKFLDLSDFTQPAVTHINNRGDGGLFRKVVVYMSFNQVYQPYLKGLTFWKHTQKRCWEIQEYYCLRLCSLFY